MRILFCLFFISYTTIAQQWLGISTSNYAGTYNIAVNPANVADSRYKFFLNIAGGNAEFTNNYAAWAAPYSFIGLFTNTVPDQYRASNGLPGFRPSYIKEAIDKNNAVAFAAADVKGPSLIYTFEKAKLAIGLTSRVRVLTNLDNTSSDVAHVMVNGTLVPDLYGITQDNNRLSLNLNGFTEIGLTLGAVIREQDQDFFKIGLSVKRLNGLLNVHYIADNLDFTIDANGIGPRRQDVFFRTAVGAYGTTTTNAIRTASLSPNWLFGNLAAGTGYGFDIGAVYEFRPEFDKYDVKINGKWRTDGTKNKYLYRIGVALIDVGNINFNNPDYVNVTQIAATNVLIQPGTFNKIDSPDRLYNQMNNAFNLNDAAYQHSFKSALPMAISSNFDYKISEKIYFNATWIQSLRNPKTVGMNQPSMFAFTPRYESKMFDVAVPIALQNGYRNFTVGLAGRAGPLFIGTENLGGILNIANPRGISAYFGLFLPIYRKLPDAPNGCYVETRTTLRQEIRDAMQKRKQKRRWNRVR
ncbi:MAG: DUF5723 family protein [Emticicia sp.]|nr:DUF5723 family protein [Emticicia sp.]